MAGQLGAPVATPEQRQQVADLWATAYTAARDEGLAQAPCLQRADAAAEAAFADGALPTVARMSCGCLEGGPHGSTLRCSFGLR